jgi:amidase
MHRRDFLRATVAGGLGALGGAACRPGDGTPPDATTTPAPFEFDEATITDLQDGMAAGRFTARALVDAYVTRIDTLDRKGPALRSVIEVNPEAGAIADQLDRERQQGRVRGPLHGIPVLLKDNIDTNDRMTTTAGSLALMGSVPAQDSFVARRLRDAGAVLLGKANLSEWANIRSTHSSSGWSARGGQCRNPYVLDRNPCGSSSGSGVAVAANLAAVAIGTETDGSIVCPSSANGIVGVKPTVGLVSRAGIIPISHTQDTAGPMTRTVRDAALVLTALAGIDPRDPATQGDDRRQQAYVAFLDEGGLKGVRIGVPRSFFNYPTQVELVLQTALDAMRAEGAILIDPVDLRLPPGIGELELNVLLYELKADLNAYLATLGPAIGVRSLADIIRFNEENRDREMPYFGQELFIEAQAKGPLTDEVYRRNLQTIRRAARDQGIDAVMDAQRLDAIVAPTGGPAWPTDLVNGDHVGGSSSAPAAIAGYPNITVPAGEVQGLPIGLSFFGRPWSEPTLFRIAYAFEQATRYRRPPTFRPTLGSSV